MKWYAVFYKRVPAQSERIESDQITYRHPCGDRSLIRIDGRLRHFKAVTIARDTCKQRGFDCFSLQWVDSLRDVNLDDNPLINIYAA